MLYKQLCVPKTILREVMYKLQNAEPGGHLGITRTIEEFSKNFFCPNYMEFIADHIRNCSTSLQMEEVHPSRLKTTLREVSALKLFPGDLMQIDILGPFPSSPYKYAVTTIDVFTKFLFAVPLTTISALSVATALVPFMFQHSYIPQEILSDLGTRVVSDLFHELMKLLEIKISDASSKHPQTIGVAERAHAASTRILKIYSKQTFTNWHKYLNLATFTQNTSYQTSIGCARTFIFHGRDPVQPLDVRFYSNCIQKSAFNYDFMESVRDEFLKIFQTTKETFAKFFNRYRRYFDQKARANQLKAQTYGLLLNPRLR